MEVQTPAPRFLQLHPEFLCSWPPEFLPRLHAYAACIDLDLKLISPHSTKISSHTMQQLHLLQKKETKQSQVIQLPLNLLGRGHPHPISLLPANCPPTLNQKMYQFIFLKKKNFTPKINADASCHLIKKKKINSLYTKMLTEEFLSLRIVGNFFSSMVFCFCFLFFVFSEFSVYSF